MYLKFFSKDIFCFGYDMLKVRHAQGTTSAAAVSSISSCFVKQCLASSVQEVIFVGFRF